MLAGVLHAPFRTDPGAAAEFSFGADNRIDGGSQDGGDAAEPFNRISYIGEAGIHAEFFLGKRFSSGNGAGHHGKRQETSCNYSGCGPARIAMGEPGAFFRAQRKDHCHVWGRRIELTFSRRQTLSRYGGGFLRSAPSLISRRRDFPGAPPGSFFPFQQVLPCFLDIDRSVYVSVVMDATCWTIPFPN